MKKKRKNNFNLNQKSFYFENFIDPNFEKKKKSFISNDRIYILFFSFLSLIIIFSIKIISVSIQENNFYTFKKNYGYFSPLRRDIVDRNGVLLSSNLISHHAAIRSNLVKNKEKFLIKLKILFPKTNTKKIKQNLETKKQFYFKKRISIEEKNKLWSLGEKAIIFEPIQTRVYPQAALFSHVLGQINDDNIGISGFERYLDVELKNKSKINEPVILSIDSNIQYILKTELEKSLKTFDAIGAAGILIDSSNGEVLSLVSLPDYNINIRQNIFEKEFSNKITNDIFELGSIFKTFTVALAIENGIVESNTIIKNIPEKVKCSVHEIGDIKKFPKDLSVEDILIRSSNVGTVKIARQVGKEKFINFINKSDLMNRPSIQLSELGQPLSFEWEKCRLETVSFGHGITTTPLQAASVYAAIANNGLKIRPTLLKNEINILNERLISETTSHQLQKILRKVVTDENGTASLADIHGYSVSGKTGTSQNYNNKKNINTFVSFFDIDEKKKYTLLVLLEDPKIAKNLIYDYRGQKIKALRNEAGWNAVYVAGKIIEKIGPILAINKEEFQSKNVVKKISF